MHIKYSIFLCSKQIQNGIQKQYSHFGKKYLSGINFNLIHDNFTHKWGSFLSPSPKIRVMSMHVNKYIYTNKKQINASVKERPQTLLVPSEEICKRVLWNKHIEDHLLFQTDKLKLSVEKMPFVNSTLFRFYLCFVPSLLEIGHVVLEKKIKLWNVYRRTDRRTTGDQKSSLELSAQVS